MLLEATKTGYVYPIHPQTHAFLKPADGFWVRSDELQVINSARQAIVSGRTHI